MARHSATSSVPLILRLERHTGVRDGIQAQRGRDITAGHHRVLQGFLRGLMDQLGQGMPLIDPPGDGASQWIKHDAEQPDRHLPDSACSGSDASCRVGLAIRC